MNKITQEMLTTRQNWDLNMKILWAKQRIKQFHIKNNGMVYVSFSGGKDSTVLLHLVRSMFPEVEGVFADTGLEYPEIRDFVKTKENITWVKPKIPFNQVIKKYGYPVVSKKVSLFLRDLQNPTENNVKTRKLRLGLLPEKSKAGVLSQKYRYLIDAPFKISHYCCDVMKKSPMKRYQTKSKKFPMIGTMVEESNSRKYAYLKKGCFDEKNNQLTPMAIFSEKDVWDYIKLFKLDYCSVYDNGLTRTGCMFCMFGVQYDAKNNGKGLNRFQLMKQSHPAQHKYCMNQLGMKEVLKFINIPTGEEEEENDIRKN